MIMLITDGKLIEEFEHLTWDRGNRTTLSNNSLYRMTPAQLSIMETILVTRCHADAEKIRGSYHHDIVYGLRIVIQNYLYYHKYNLSRYLLRYSSDVDKIREALDGEFMITNERDFYSHLSLNKITANCDCTVLKSLNKFMESLPQEIQDHPYIHVIKHTSSYSKAKRSYIEHQPYFESRILTRDKLNEIALKMFPKTRHFTLEEKINILLYRHIIHRAEYRIITVIMKEGLHSDGMIKKVERHTVDLNYITRFMSMRLLHTCAKLDTIPKSGTLGMLNYFEGPSLGYNIIKRSTNLDYVRYFIKHTIETGDVKKIVDSIIPMEYGMRYIHINKQRMKWLIQHNLVDNLLFRRLHSHLSSCKFKIMLDRYFSQLDC